MGKEITGHYGSLLAEIKARVRSAQYAALRAVNRELVGLYWDIGRLIVARQAAEGWGRAVIKKLARDLQMEFPGIAGFSSQNLWYMRQFYLVYKASSKLQPLVGEISWSKNLLVIGRCSDENEREFYIKSAAKFGWTKAVLAHNIEAQTYQKYLANQTNFDAA